MFHDFYPCVKYESNTVFFQTIMNGNQFSYKILVEKRTITSKIIQFGAFYLKLRGWSGSAMILGKLSVLRRPTI